MPCICKTDKVAQIGHDFITTIFTTFILITDTTFIYTNTTDKLPQSVIIMTIRLFKTTSYTLIHRAKGRENSITRWE